MGYLVEYILNATFSWFIADYKLYVTHSTSHLHTKRTWYFFTLFLSGKENLSKYTLRLCSKMVHKHLVDGHI